MYAFGAHSVNWFLSGSEHCQEKQLNETEQVATKSIKSNVFDEKAKKTATYQ